MYKYKYNKYKNKYFNLKLLTGGNNIKVFTWNLCWESMKGSKSKHLNMEKCISINNKINNCKIKTLEILQQVLNLKTDLISLQEYDISNDLYKLNNINDYNIINGKSDKETGISLFRKDKFSYIRHEFGDLCSENMGRVYVLIELLNKINNEKIIFINVHFPHEDRPFKGARKKAEEKMKNLISKFKDHRIIIAGDHNYEYTEDSYEKFIGRTFYIDKDSKSTCCSTNISKLPQLKYDIILDSKDKNIKFEFLNNPIYKNIYVSDHLPFFANIKI